MYTVTITSQGQISIPAKFRRELGFEKTRRAVVTKESGKLIIEPIKDFLELGGSLKTKIKVSPKQIREGFENYLAEEGMKGLPRETLRELGFKEIAPNVFAPPKK